MLLAVWVDLLRSPTLVPSEARLLVAAGGVALSGWLAFGAWFSAPFGGQIFTWALFAASGAYLLKNRARVRHDWIRRSELWIPALMMVAIGVSYIGILWLFRTELPIDKLAANRFIGLPVDNEIPRLFAERLIRGESPRELIGDWLSSDRPPLQTGLILLVYPMAALLRLPIDVLGQCTGMWFHLLWIPAIWAVVRMWGGSRGLSSLVIALMCTGATPVLYTLYVWPKLGAAALVIGTFLIYFAPGERTAGRLAIAAALAAAGWLAHGGVAFSLIGLAVLALITSRLRPLPIAAGVLTFLVLATPWIAYQKLYEPPGDRLLKWHIAGVIPIDERSFGETVKQAYGDLTWEQIWALKRANFDYVFQRGREAWLDFSPAGLPGRRSREFYHLFAVQGLWNVGWIGLFWLGWMEFRRRKTARAALPVSLDAPLFSRSLAWSILSLAGWLLLMFGPGTTSIHQGTLVLPLLMSASCMVLARCIHPFLLAALGAWQIGHFVVTWLPRNPALNGKLDYAAVSLLLGGMGILGGLVYLSHRCTEAIANPPATPSDQL